MTLIDVQLNSLIYSQNISSSGMIWKLLKTKKNVKYILTVYFREPNLQHAGLPSLDILANLHLFLIGQNRLLIHFDEATSHSQNIMFLNDIINYN